MCGERGPGVLWPPTFILKVAFLLVPGGSGGVHCLRGERRKDEALRTGRGSWLPVGAAPACTWLVRRGKCADTGNQTCFLTGLSGEKKILCLREDNLIILEVWISGSSRARGPSPQEGRAACEGPGRHSAPYLPMAPETLGCRVWTESSPQCLGPVSLSQRGYKRACRPQAPGAVLPARSRKPSPPRPAECPSLEDLSPRCEAPC